MTDSLEYILTFFNKINNIIQQKGNKRKRNFTNKKIVKKQKGEIINEDLNLPIPLNDRYIFDIEQLKN